MALHINDYQVYIDFDSTLYDTAKFADDLATMLCERFRIDKDTYRKASRDYFAHPGLGGYDFTAHTSAFNIPTDVAWATLDALVGDKDYLYPDAAEFIASLFKAGLRPKVLSFGEQRFQEIKIKAALPHLLKRTTLGTHDMEYYVVFKKKREHILENHPGERGVLVDDVPDQQLPSGFTEIHIDRKAALAAPEKDGDVYRVGSLDRARTIIEQMATQH